jgi:hypothetical protein
VPGAVSDLVIGPAVADWVTGPAVADWVTGPAVADWVTGPNVAKAGLTEKQARETKISNLCALLLARGKKTG